MTHTDYIKLMLNIKDNNVYFYDDFLILYSLFTILFNVFVFDIISSKFIF